MTETPTITEMISVYAPTGPSVEATTATALKTGRPWDQIQFALVDNGKPGGLALLTGIADALQIPAARRTLIAKQIASEPMNDEQLRTIEQNCQAAILAVGNCGSCTSWTCHDSVTVASKLGVPSVLIITTPFEQIARHVSESLGRPDQPVVIVEHPVGDLPFEVIRQRGEDSAGQVRDFLLPDGAPNPESVVEGQASGIEQEGFDFAETELAVVENDQAAIDAFYVGKEWSDGLPIVAPTERRVEDMLGRHLDRADEVIGTVATGYGAATLRSIAVNAVMAGCRPEYFDVVVAVVKAIVHPEFNLHAIQATTHPVAPLILVNGPIADRIGVNAGTNALGSGHPANATIGRAMRLVMLNVGRCVPGATDRATFGHPGKYTYCLAENEAESPWEPFHVARGFSPETSTVTLLGSEGPHNMNDPGSVSDAGLLKTFVGCMNTPGSNHHEFPKTEPLVLLSPEHARLLARHGHNRRSLQEYFFEHCRSPLSDFSQERIERFLARRRPVWFGPENTTGVAALADDPADFLIGVAGGPGTHSVFIPSFGGTKSVTVAIDEE